MIIEYGHVYVADIDSGNIDIQGIKKSIDLAISRMKSEDFLVVLIDDKEFNLSAGQKHFYENVIRSLYLKLGLEPHEVFFEKSFSLEASAFIQNISLDRLSVESFRKENKRVTFFKDGARKIPLLTETSSGIFYSCQLLSSLWRKHKENLVVGHEEAICLTILDSKYEAVESDVASLCGIYPSSMDINHLYLWY